MSSSAHAVNRNGAVAHVGTLGTPLLERDPFERALALGSRMPAGVTIAALVLAVALHAGAAVAAVQAAVVGAFASWAESVGSAVASRLMQSFDVEVVKPPEPPPLPAEVEPAKPAKEDPKPPPVAVKAPKEAPPPAAAEASKVLAQDPVKEEPLDLTGNTFVQGSGSTYAGGVTQAGGTSKTAVYNPAASASGVAVGVGRSGVDKTRSAALSGAGEWNDCPFPSEADAEQIDQAAVTLQVSVRSDGSADAVTVVQDPGYGFGREARKCAMRKRYANALDANGNPVSGTTKPFRVRFNR